MWNAFASHQRHIKDVRLIKDKATGASRGFCFVDCGTVQDASYLLDVWTKNSLTIDGRHVKVGYAYSNTSSPASNEGGGGSSGKKKSVVKNYYDSTYNWDGNTSIPNNSNNSENVLNMINRKY